MKKFLSVTCLAVLFAVASQAQPVLTATKFGNEFLRSKNAASALSLLGDINATTLGGHGADSFVLSGDIAVLPPQYQTNISMSDFAPNDYGAFPITAVSDNGSTIYTVWRNSVAHGSGNPSSVILSVSTNFGLTQVSTLAVTNSGFDLRNFSFGVGESNRLVLIVSKYDITNARWDSLPYYTSDDGGLTWTNRGTINTNLVGFNTDAFSAYGRIKKLNGVLYGGMYSENLGTNAIDGMWMLISRDNGETWTNSPIVNTAQGNSVSEPAILPITDKLFFAVARKTAASASYPFLFHAYWSTNGGESWFWRDPEDRMYAYPNSTNAAYSSPCDLALKASDEGPKICMFWGDRFSNKLLSSEATVESVWKNPSTLSNSNVVELGRSIYAETPPLADGGMGSAVPLSGGQWFGSYYYVEQSGTVGEVRFVNASEKLAASTNLIVSSGSATNTLIFRAGKLVKVQ
jgi:hypothetical protein